MKRQIVSPAADGEARPPRDGAVGPNTRAHSVFARLIPAGRIGVAVSGGGDSMALLVLLTAWAGSGRVVGVTIDHGLRAESAAEAQAVAQQCRQLGVAHETRTIGALAKGNLSAMLREARYQTLTEWARRHDIRTVALGHTLDDQAETVLMRLARGSGADGLSGMAEATTWKNILWVRPLMGERRADLRAYLKARAIPWIDDPTNEDPRFDRVRARQALAALAPLGIDAEGLAETATRLSRQRKVLDRAMADLAEIALAPGVAGDLVLDLPALRSAVPDTSQRLLAQCVMHLSGATYRPRYRALQAAWASTTAAQPRAATVAGCLLQPRRGKLHVCREPAAVAAPVALRGGEAEWDGRWRVQGAADEDAVVGALGEHGLALCTPNPGLYDQAPRMAWTTTPAIWDRSGTLVAAPVAVPKAVPEPGPVAIAVPGQVAGPAAAPATSPYFEAIPVGIGAVDRRFDKV